MREIFWDCSSEDYNIFTNAFNEWVKCSNPIHLATFIKSAFESKCHAILVCKCPKNTASTERLIPLLAKGLSDEARLSKEPPEVLLLNPLFRGFVINRYIQEVDIGNEFNYRVPKNFKLREQLDAKYSLLKGRCVFTCNTDKYSPGPIVKDFFVRNGITGFATKTGTTNYARLQSLINFLQSYGVDCHPTDEFKKELCNEYTKVQYGHKLMDPGERFFSYMSKRVKMDSTYVNHIKLLNSGSKFYDIDGDLEKIKEERDVCLAFNALKSEIDEFNHLIIAGSYVDGTWPESIKNEIAYGRALQFGSQK